MKSSCNLHGAYRATPEITLTLLCFLQRVSFITTNCAVLIMWNTMMLLERRLKCERQLIHWNPCINTLWVGDVWHSELKHWRRCKWLLHWSEKPCIIEKKSANVTYTKTIDCIFALLLSLSPHGSSRRGVSVSLISAGYSDTDWHSVTLQDIEVGRASFVLSLPGKSHQPDYEYDIIDIALMLKWTLFLFPVSKSAITWTEKILLNKLREDEKLG